MISLATSRRRETNIHLPPDVLSHGHVSRHNTLLCITSCFRFSLLIAQLVGRHEDVFHQENSCLPRAFPSSDNYCLGGTNLHVSIQTGQ